MKFGIVIVRLLGGLGNQMFQYAVGRRLSIERAVPLRLDLSALEKDAQRNYALGDFAVEAEEILPKDLAGMMPWPAHLPRRLSWLPRLPGRIKLHLESEFTYDPSVPGLPDAVYLNGYWQSERYFSKIADQIREDFQLSQPMTANRQNIAAEIGNNNAVSIHVRRGDYVSNPTANAHHGTCSPEWYERAILEMAEAVKSPTFFVFSDDPDWARANLPRNWSYQFIEPQSDGRDCEDMHLMTLCNHHIIANSSFSWWGAWLNPDAGKKVIAPLNWFAQSSHDTRDLIPHDWRRL